MDQTDSVSCFARTSTKPANPTPQGGGGDIGALGVFEPGAATVVADEILEEGVEAVEMEVAAIYAEIESLNARMT